MTVATSNKRSHDTPPAIERTRELLTKRHTAFSFDADLGYIDLIDGQVGPSNLNPLTIAMRMPLVSAVYERYWRPGFGILLKGLGGPSMQEEYRLAIELMNIRRGEMVLDLACGPGNFSRRFAAAVGRSGLVVGYDGSPAMLRRAIGEQTTDVQAQLAYVHGDATALPFRAGSFDSVCCFAALHMFPDPMTSLDQAARVLKRGGRIALLTSRVGDSGPHNWIIRHAGQVSGQRMFSEDEITDSLESRGFRIQTRRFAGVAQLVGAIKQ